MTTKEIDANTIHDLKLEVQKQSTITRSKSFNLQMLMFMVPAAVYFWLFESSYVFSGVLSSNPSIGIAVFSILPTFYAVTLAFDSIHSVRFFRAFCRIIPVLGVGLGKLVLSAFTGNDYLLQSPILTIKNRGSFSSKLTYIDQLLQSGDSSLSLDLCKIIAKECETLKEIEASLNEALYRTANSSAFEKISGYVNQNGLGICGFVIVSVTGMGVLSNVASAFNVRRPEDLQGIQTLESQIQALTQRTRELSAQRSVSEKAINHNQSVNAMRFDNVVRNMQTTSQDVASLGATMLPNLF